MNKTWVYRVYKNGKYIVSTKHIETKKAYEKRGYTIKREYGKIKA